MATSASPSVIAARAVFTALGSFMLAVVIYTVVTDGLPFRLELLTPWMAATLVDFYINVAAIAVWVVYKESSLLNAVIWIILLICLGSITTCFYIVYQLCHISSQDSGRHCVYHILLRHNDRSGNERKCSTVLIGRIVFSMLGCLMLTVLIYTIVTDGSPFRKELLTPWLTATLIDFYINVVAISAWIAYKEPTWMGAIVWIILLICFGSISTCAYIVVQLCHISINDPMHLILGRSRNRHEDDGGADRDLVARK